METWKPQIWSAGNTSGIYNGNPIGPMSFSLTTSTLICPTGELMIGWNVTVATDPNTTDSVTQDRVRLVTRLAPVCGRTLAPL